MSGGGVEHTLGSDLRIAADNTRILMPELDMGIFFSNGSINILPRLIGESRAKQMMLLGEEITAEKALEFGLVTEVCTPETLDDHLRCRAEKLAAKDPYALKLAKQLIHGAREDTLNGSLYKEGCAMVDTGRSKGAKSRIQAF
ncbi:MAG: enoyl-CoA hydratase/isomerase family protein [Desulfobacter sp.]|nr:enoyl-CoA hydratase/isomerase family protein [Desulfobacter sp.]